MCWACRALSSALPGALAALAVLAAPGARAQEAPPRNAADVINQLKVQGAGLTNRARDAEAAKATLVEPDPGDADQTARLGWHQRRANAHAVLGDPAAQKLELQRALETAGSIPLLRFRALGSLFAFELDAGSMLAAREHASEQVEIGRGLRPGQLLPALTRLVLVNNRLGERAGAERALSQLDALIIRVRRGDGWSLQGEFWTALLERSRGKVHELRGNLAAAELSAQTALASAERYYAQQGERAGTDEERERVASATGLIEALARDLAGYQNAQGKLLAAELTSRKALQLSLKRAGFASAATARSLQNLAGILVEQGRYADGEALAREALRSAESAGLGGASEVLVHARQALGNALAMQSRWEETVRVFGERSAAVQQADPALRRALRFGNFNWALALIKTGRHEQARRLLETMRKRFESFGDEANSARVAYARGFIGLSLVEQGQNEQAMAEFRASVPHILEAAFRDQREEREGAARIARMNFILEGYMRALAEIHRGNPDAAAAAEMFRVADFARGSRVQRALSLGAGRAAARDPQLLKLVDEDERLLDRVTVLSGVAGELAGAPDERRLDQVINQMRGELAQIDRQRKALRERIAREFPDYADLVAPKPVTLDDARKALHPGEALLSIYLAEDRLYVWAIAREGDPAFASAKTRREEILADVAALRKALDVGSLPLERFPAFDTRLAHDLYVKLVQPVEPRLRGANTLLVAPHGALGQIPFALLVTAPAPLQATALPFEQYRAMPWLLRNYAVVQLPSVSSLVTLARLPPATAGRKAFVGYGDPLFSKDAAQGAAMLRGVSLRNLAISRSETSAAFAKLPQLPDTREEVREIARVLRADPDQDVFLGSAASRKNADQAHLAGRRVIAFATHGLIPGDLDGLTQPALALSSPEVTGIADDGLLTMEDILALRLNADWVVLSACNTAAAEGAGGEAVSGLGRAFFFAGARALLVSNWPVETVSARLLTTDLFNRQASDPKLTRAEALRQTMLALLDQGVAKDATGKTLFTYAHPMFWAPFSLIGDGSSN